MGSGDLSDPCHSPHHSLASPAHSCLVITLHSLLFLLLAITVQLCLFQKQENKKQKGCVLFLWNGVGRGEEEHKGESHPGQRETLDEPWGRAG
jgi:hypothetical protein